jgi:hypothetical protein
LGIQRIDTLSYIKKNYSYFMILSPKKTKYRKKDRVGEKDKKFKGH